MKDKSDGMPIVFGSGNGGCLSPTFVKGSIDSWKVKAARRGQPQGRGRGHGSPAPKEGALTLGKKRARVGPMIDRGGCRFWCCYGRVGPLGLSPPRGVILYNLGRVGDRSFGMVLGKFTSWSQTGCLGLLFLLSTPLSTIFLPGIITWSKPSKVAFMQWFWWRWSVARDYARDVVGRYLLKAK